MTFSTNQNRQMFVTNAAAVKNNKAGLANVGDIFVKKLTADGNLYLLQKGHGGLVRSDLIDPASIMWANASAPADTAIKLKSKKLVLDTENAGIYPGQTYIVRVSVRQAFGMSDEDIYVKIGAIKATKAMVGAPKVFYMALAASLFRNFKRLYQPLIEISDGTNTAAVIKDGTLYKADGETALEFTDGIFINEASQEDAWSLGRAQYTPVYYEVVASTIEDEDGVEVAWGKVTDNTKTYNKTVGNGYNTADLEYFCMKERGDQYGFKGWPATIQPKMIADPTKKYYYLDVHYAYQGTCEDIQKSEKTLTIAATKKSVIAAIITAWDITAKATDAYTNATDA